MQANTLFSNSQNNAIVLDSLKAFHGGRDYDTVITGILQNILHLYKANRTYMFLYDFERGIQRHEYEICAQNTSTQQANIYEVPLSDTPFVNDFVFNKKPWVINRLSEIKEYAPSEYEILKSQDVTSLILVPLIFRENVLGYIGIDMVSEYKTWDENDLNLLFSLSQIISTSVDMNHQLKQSKVKVEQAENGYNQIQRVFNGIYNDIPVGIELYDADGFLVDINPVELNHFGIKSKESVIGVSVFDNPILPDYAKQLLREGKDFEIILDYDFQKLEGYFNSSLAESTMKCFNVMASVVRDKGGNIYCYQLFVTDITNLRRTQNELIIAKQKAEESNRLKSLFLANMSHEIRTPLNAIVGFSDLLHLSNSPEELNQFKNIIKENSDLLLKIVNDILDLSKIEAGVLDVFMETFDLVMLMEDVARTIKMNFNNPSVEFRIHSPNPYFFVTTDKQRMAQIMVNFLSNAFKNTSSGQIVLGYEPTLTGAKIFVEDTGIGIPKEKHPLVFRRFEKLDVFAQGTGLGLTICKAIADVLGADIGLESEAGRGSLFWFSFPCNDKMIRTEG
ncbi:MAG: ATP-binding protein [Phocaeicola sp.]